MAEDCHLKDTSLPLSAEPPISTNLIVRDIVVRVRVEFHGIVEPDHRRCGDGV